ncbi:MAG: hypothetical protein JST82_14225 [Bacteroidetes bacterium]|nr:hypothetical protein [Bacteroidota bacterium]
MKKLIFILFVMLGSIDYVKACNICGCSASNQYLGILPQSKSNFIGVQYQYRSFFNTHMPEAGELNGEISKEYYHMAQVWGRYKISNRVQVFAFVPYVSNVHQETNAKTIYNGIGDISILANYKILGAVCSGKEWQHVLQAGAGIKLPAGKYDRMAIKYSDALPNMQPGTASLDFITNINYTFQHTHTGINTDVSYIYTTSNPDKYRFGNRFQGGMLIFYSMGIKKLRLIPQIGGRYEYTYRDYENYFYGIKNDMSGGGRLSGSAGIQAFYDHIGIQVAFHKPIVQNYANGMVNNKLKIETGIYWLF